MEKIFVEYMAYLSYLMQMDENIGLNEKELIYKYKLYDKVNILIKCSNTLRHKIKAYSPVYKIKPLIHMKDKYISDLTKSDDIVTLEITKKELENLEFPINVIYKLHNFKNNYYIQEINNIFIMKRLSELEINSLDNQELKYYEKFSKGILYAKEIEEDGNIYLTKLHNPVGEYLENSNHELCYVIDEDYPNSFLENVEYLKGKEDGSYTKAMLPIKEDSVLKRIFKKS